MSNMEIRCKICTTTAEIAKLERVLNTVDQHLSDLLVLIPKDYEPKQINSPLIRRKMFVGLCGYCPNKYDEPYHIKEKEMFNKVLKVLSYFKEFPNTFTLSKLKHSLKDHYFGLYRLITTIEG